MSIEFGVLREGSTITLIGTQRATVDEEIFDELVPIFLEIQKKTGEEIDQYGSASFEGAALSIFIEELESVKSMASKKYSEAFYETVKELLRVAYYAKEQSKPLSYFGE